MARGRPGLLILLSGDGSNKQTKLQQDITTIGRSSSCTIVIQSPTVSRLHARIEIQHDRYVLFDAGSANGTFVNGNLIAQGYQLSTGDEIALGSLDLLLSFTDPEQTLATQPGVGLTALQIDEDARTVKVYGVLIHLSPLEYGLLLHLASNPGTVCTRSGCFQAVWGSPYEQETCEDALNACIAKLRRNVRMAAQQANYSAPAITTVQRVGFRLDADVAFTPRNRQLHLEERQLQA